MKLSSKFQVPSHEFTAEYRHSCRRDQVATRNSQLGTRNCPNGFTLLEVIIACAIFFVVAFAILQLVTSSLVAAKALQQREPDPGMIAASLSLSNILEDGLTLTGDFEDLAPGLYKGYRWMAEANEVSSNSLFQVDIVVYRDVQKKGPAESKISILRYAPGSKPGRAFGTGATGGR